MLEYIGIMARFRGRKQYGQSKVSYCSFCGKIATQKSDTGLEVCLQHKSETLEEIKCTCGKWLEQRDGKFGAYFNCINCGNVNYAKAMEIKAITHDPSKQKKKEAPLINTSPHISKPISSSSYVHNPYSRAKKRISAKEIEITSDDLEYFD